METNIINFGNSKGIIIPAKFLKMIGLDNIVNIEIDEGKLVISPANRPRAGWEELIKMKKWQAKSLLADFEDEN